MSGQPPFTWDEKSTRQAVSNRSGGYCEYCGARATNMHHRINRSHGGRWSPANILHLCGSGVTGCHGRFESERELAYELGVCIRGNNVDVNPANIPVHTPIQLLWLTDDVAPPFPKGFS